MRLIRRCHPGRYPACRSIPSRSVSHSTSICPAIASILCKCCHRKQHYKHHYHCDNSYKLHSLFHGHLFSKCYARILHALSVNKIIPVCAEYINVFCIFFTKTIFSLHKRKAFEKTFKGCFLYLNSFNSSDSIRRLCV